MENDKEEFVEEKKEIGYSVGNLLPAYREFSIPKINISGAITALETTSRILGSCVFTMNDTLNRFSSSVAQIVNSYSTPFNNMLTSITSGMFAFLDRIAYSPLAQLVEKLSQFDFERFQKNLDRIYFEALYEAKWFPHAVCTKNIELFESINDVLDSTRSGSNNRIKKLDKVIFSFYNKKTLNELKKLWKEKDLPNHIKKILGQAIQAYQRKEYALTVSALATLWEGFIDEKTSVQVGYRKGKRIQDELNKLLTENGCNSVAQMFCEEYIFYDCNKPSEVKPDVPGRHCIAHSWYDGYPSRKTALNAIIFTDFLLELDNVVENIENQDEVKDND